MTRPQNAPKSRRLASWRLASAPECSVRLRRAGRLVRGLLLSGCRARFPDALVEFAAANGMQVNGHVLVWQQLPTWLERGGFGRDELMAILRETFWSRGIGPDYLMLAFRWAHEADPDAHLRYNDYGGEGLGAKSNGIDLLAALRTAGSPPTSAKWTCNWPCQRPAPTCANRPRGTATCCTPASTYRHAAASRPGVSATAIRGSRTSSRGVAMPCCSTPTARPSQRMRASCALRDAAAKRQ